MAMRTHAPSGFTRGVQPVGARRGSTSLTALSLSKGCLAPTSSLATRTLSTHYGSINLLDSLHFQCYTRRQRFVQRPMQASLKGVGKMPRAWRAAPAKPC